MTRRPAWSSVACGVAAFALYAWQAPAVPGDKDAAELTLALATFGVPHPTGYPLWLLLGHGFVKALHGLGVSWALAANLWSALGGAVAVGLLHALARRLLGGHGLAALVPVALFATNPVWTYEASLAEVYSWHVAWVAGAALAFVAACARLEGEAPARLRLAFGWGLVCGVGGAHHATALLVAAPLSLGLLHAGLRLRRVGAREVLAVLAGAAVPLLAYGVVAWRAFHPAAWQWPTLEPSWASVARHVTGGGYGGYLGRFAPSAEQRELLAGYVTWVLWPLLLTFLAGARWLASQRTWWPLAAAAVLSLGFAYGYGVPDPSSYFVAPLALSTVGAAWALRAGLGGPRTRGLVLGVSAVVVLGLGGSWAHLGVQRRAVFERFDARVRSMWASVPYEEALVLWPSDMAARLLLLQRLEGDKPRVEVVNPLLLLHPVVREAFRARHGFDPLEGVALPSRGLGGGEEDAFAAAVGARLNAQSALPVILFDPERESVRLLRKAR